MMETVAPYLQSPSVTVTLYNLDYIPGWVKKTAPILFSLSFYLFFLWWLSEGRTKKYTQEHTHHTHTHRHRHKQNTHFLYFFTKLKLARLKELLFKNKKYAFLLYISQEWMLSSSFCTYLLYTFIFTIFKSS